MIGRSILLATWPDGGEVSRIESPFGPDAVVFLYEDPDLKRQGIQHRLVFEEFGPWAGPLSSDGRFSGLVWWTAGPLGSVPPSTSRARILWAIFATGPPGFLDLEAPALLSEDLPLPLELPENFVERFGPESEVDRTMRSLGPLLLANGWPDLGSAQQPKLRSLLDFAAGRIGGWHTYLSTDPPWWATTFAAGAHRAEYTLIVGGRISDRIDSHGGFECSSGVQQWMFGEGSVRRRGLAAIVDPVDRLVGIGMSPWEAAAMVPSFHPAGGRASWEARFLDPGVLQVEPDLFSMLGELGPWWRPDPEMLAFT